MVAAVVVGFFLIACQVGALRYNLRVTGKFPPCQWLYKLLKQHFLYSFQIICVLREKTKHKTTRSYFTEIKKSRCLHISRAVICLRAEVYIN